MRWSQTEAQKQVDRVLNRLSQRRHRRDQLVALGVGVAVGAVVSLAVTAKRNSEDG